MRSQLFVVEKLVDGYRNVSKAPGRTVLSCEDGILPSVTACLPVSHASAFVTPQVLHPTCTYTSKHTASLSTCVLSKCLLSQMLVSTPTCPAAQSSLSTRLHAEDTPARCTALDERRWDRYTGSDYCCLKTVDSDSGA